MACQTPRYRFATQLLVFIGRPDREKVACIFLYLSVCGELGGLERRALVTDKWVKCTSELHSTSYASNLYKIAGRTDDETEQLADGPPDE